jgi:hypothetical protein
VESQNRVNLDSYEMPDLKVLDYCPDLQAYLLTIKINPFDIRNLSAMIKEYNQKNLQLAMDITVQIEHGHEDFTEEYVKISRALSQKVLEDRIRHYFNRPKPMPKKYIYRKTITYILTFCFLVSTGYLGYAMYNQLQELPSTNQPKSK